MRLTVPAQKQCQQGEKQVQSTCSSSAAGATHTQAAAHWRSAGLHQHCAPAAQEHKAGSGSECGSTALLLQKGLLGLLLEDRGSAGALLQSASTAAGRGCHSELELLRHCCQERHCTLWRGRGEEGELVEEEEEEELEWEGRPQRAHALPAPRSASAELWR